jgi:nitrile hydratase
MNGIHDMGGMQDMGPIEAEKNEPVFHAPWEARVYAMARAVAATGKLKGGARLPIESLTALEYLQNELLRKSAPLAGHANGRERAGDARRA